MDLRNYVNNYNSPKQTKRSSVGGGKGNFFTGFENGEGNGIGREKKEKENRSRGDFILARLAVARERGYVLRCSLATAKRAIFLQNILS